MKFKILMPLTSLLIGIIFLYGISNAEQKKIVKEYSYQAGEQDSKSTSRVLAMTQIKRLVLEEAGTYIASTTKVKDLKLESDQITAMTAGIVSLNVIDESWDGKVFYMKAEATIDTDDVEKKLENIAQNQDVIGELESTQQKIDELEAEVESLKAGMLAMQNQVPQNGQAANNSLQPVPGQTARQDYVTRYNDTVDQMRSLDMVQNSYVYINSGDYPNAMNSLDSAIVLSPQAAPAAYIARSIVYANLNAPQKAAAALNKAVRLDPDIETRAILVKAFMYERSGDNKLALEEVNRAISKDPHEPWAYRLRAGLYIKGGSREPALADMKEARKLHDIHRLRQEFINARPSTQEHTPVIKITNSSLKGLEEKPAPVIRSQEKVRGEQEKHEKERLERKQRLVKQQQNQVKRQQERQVRLAEARHQNLQRRQQVKKEARPNLKQVNTGRQRQNTVKMQKMQQKASK